MKLGRSAAIAVGIFGLAQLFPYGRDHSNPPAGTEPAWSSTEVRTLFYRACRDCHTNETTWPWYSHVAPVSWLVQHDVDEGRRHLNVSDWDRKRPRQHGDEAAEMVQEGEMPLWYYLPLHSSAQLSSDERDRLIAGLKQTFPDSDHKSSGDHAH